MTKKSLFPFSEYVETPEKDGTFLQASSFHEKHSTVQNAKWQVNVDYDLSRLQQLQQRHLRERQTVDDMRNKLTSAK